MEHCHKKPFAVNKAVATAWGVNRRPAKSCENDLSATFTKWVRGKGKTGHLASSVLLTHTGQGSPLPIGIGIMHGCTQLLGHRPTGCAEVGEHLFLPAAVKTLARLPDRASWSVPEHKGCSPQPWPHSKWWGYQYYDSPSPRGNVQLQTGKLITNELIVAGLEIWGLLEEEAHRSRSLLQTE